MDHQEQQVTQDLPDRTDPLEEADQELWVLLELMDFQVDQDLRVRRGPRVFQDYLVFQAQMDLLDFQELFLKAVEICCVQPSVLQVLLDPRECLDSRVIQVIKEVRERWGKTERRVIRARRGHRESQGQWVYRVLEG